MLNENYKEFKLGILELCDLNATASVALDLIT